MKKGRRMQRLPPCVRRCNQPDLRNDTGIFAGAVMRPMQLETSVYEMAVVYFRICIGFSVLQGIISAISAVLRSYGKPKLAVTVSLL